MKAEIFVIVQEWVNWFDSYSLLNSPSKKQNIHHGQFKNRVEELQKWSQVLPHTCLYSCEEKDYTLEADNPIVLMKMAFAGMILIIDDCFDSLDKEGKISFNEVWESNDSFEFKANSGIEAVRECFGQINRILDLGLTFFEDSELSSLFLSSVKLFKSGTSSELTLQCLIEKGSKISFEERIKYSSLQGAMVSVHIDSWRLKSIGVPLNEKEMLLMTQTLSSLLAVMNAQKTNDSEVIAGEISGPLYILACELGNADLLSKKGNYSWYKAQTIIHSFRTIVNDTIAHLYNEVRVLMGFNNLDFKRFFGSLSLIT
jgi:hypothetical protein